MTKSEQLTKKIEGLKKELATLEKEKSELDSLKTDESLAVELHEICCHDNHIDGCGWEYEFANGKHDWRGGAHARYLKKARECLAVNSKESVLKIASIISRL